MTDHSMRILDMYDETIRLQEESLQMLLEK